jgi:predicted Ser/Thr protein kinase
MIADPLKQLGKYQLVDVLGEGAMGVVYRAFDRVLNRYLAIKVMSATIANDVQLRERFLREARTAGSLQHPNVITIYDFGEADGYLFIAMEYVDGEDLAAIISRREELDIAKKLDIIIDALGGLAYAHNRGVVHRDIKPANIRVNADTRAKLMDFGIAHLHKSELTQTGMLLGTPQYMAPEQVSGGAITAATDIFALGSVLYEFLTYTKPFEGETLHVILYNIVTIEPPPISRLLPSAPPALDKILAKALAKDPLARYQGAVEMANALSTARTALRPSGDAATVALRTSQTFRVQLPTPPSAQPLTAGPVPTMIRTSQIQGFIADEVAKKQRWALWLGIAGGAALVGAALWVMLSRPAPAGTATAPAQVSAAAPTVAQPPAPRVESPSTPASAPATQSRAPAGRPGDAGRTADQSRGAPPAGRAAATAAVPLVADSVLNSVRTAALNARRRAQDAGANASDLARGDSMLRVAELSVAQSRGVDALAQLGSASTMWAEGERAARDRAAAPPERPAPPPVRVPVVTPPPVSQPETAAKPPADARPEIEQVVAAYARAIESGSVAEIRRAYPGLTASQQQGWDGFFRTVRNFKATLVIDQVSVTGATASAGINATYVYDNRSTGRADRQQLRLQATLSRESGGWRLDSIR